VVLPLVRHGERRPAREQQRGQGDDERGHPRPGDQQAVDQADGPADGQGERDRRERALAGAVGGQHPGQGEQRADRQVDPAADDHERHPDRDQGQERARDGDVAEVLDAGEAAPEGDCAGDDRHRQDEEHGAALEQAGDLLAPPGPGLGPARVGGPCGHRLGLPDQPVGAHVATLGRCR
jgi:hypothetical protein